MRRLVISLLLLGAVAYGSARWYLHRLEVAVPDVGFEVALPASFEPLVAQIELIRPLHEKKRPNLPGDWLDRFPEGGQTFGHYVQFRSRKPLKDEYQTIYVQPLGEFDETQQRLAKQTAEFMEHFFGMPVQLLEARPLDGIPETAHRMRDDEQQILTTWILDDVLRPKRPDNAIAVIGLVTCDLWSGSFNWLFGQASIIDRVGVWSLHRNGDPRASDEAYRLCLRRTLKTAVHETGHMLGIPHCSAYECCMNGSRSREESDRQPMEFCPECQPKIWWTCGADPVKRGQALEQFANENGLTTEAAVWQRQWAALQHQP